MGHIVPYKGVTEVMTVFYTLQYIVEHWADQLPTIAALGPFLVPIALATVFPMFYFLYKRGTQSKTEFWILVALYFVLIGVFKGFEFGFPKDTAAEQIEALTDADYNNKHLFLHCVLLAYIHYVSSHIPSSPKAAAETKKAQ